MTIIKLKKNQHGTQINSALGQSLFEVIFALAIAAVVLVALVALSATSIRNSTYSKNSVQATQLAQETTEWLRGERDRDWVTFAARSSAGGTLWCFPNQPLAWPGSSSVTCTTTVSNTIFTRSVTLVQRDIDGNSVIDTIDAAVTISWVDSQGQHDSRNNARFTDWRR
jgi:type II secretory pathway pseudopilin PulG